jgi:exosortase
VQSIREDQVQSNLRRGFIIAVFILAAVTAWSYWPTMADLYKDWQRDDDYSAGQLVPLVALFFAWRDRRKLGESPLKPCWWGGIALILLALAGRAYGLLFLFESAERYSLVLSVAALVLLVTGWQVFRRASWILLYLFLMVPLPGRVHNMIGGPLQNLATTGSVFFLEAFGARVSQQGNVVMLGENTPMAVAEACSGLRMLTAFIVVAGFIAYMVKRPRWQKAGLLVSSIPVAVICNMVRIFLTAMLMLYVSEELAKKFFHDFAGLVMMPAAVMLMFGELWIMDRLVVPDESGSPQKQAQGRTGAPEPAPAVIRRRTR